MRNYDTWEGLVNRYEIILNKEPQIPPYDDAEYFEYTKLNRSRINRWLKIGKLEDETIEQIKSIKEQQTWNLILEPWCGDAAQIAPFIYLMSKINPNITLKIIWRDTPPFMIEEYLTNGSKSIPKLIIRDDKEKDILIWGPRPKKCQDLYLSLKEKEIDMNEIKTALQNWYNQDKGSEVQKEILQALKA